MSAAAIESGAATAKSRVPEVDVREGAQNLLANYMQLKKGAELLIVNEPPPTVEPHTAELIEEEARAIGARVLMMRCDRVAGPESLPGALVKAFEAAENTLFNHQVGAMLRLLPIGGTGLKCLNFATTDVVLGSSFCKVPFATTAEILRLVQERLNRARRWRITCRAGTDLSGEVTSAEQAAATRAHDGFTLLTFPLGVHRPFSTFAASGTVAIRWLTPSGIHEFKPAGIRLDAPVLAQLDHGKITGFSGSGAQISRLRNYMESIARQVNKEPYIINSWHAGINPRAFSPWRDVDSLERWMFLAHANPRLVHLHVIGEPAPGEMSAPVLDPTISMDDEVMWDNGRLVFLQREEVAAALSGYPGAGEALTQTFAIGL